MQFRTLSLVEAVATIRVGHEIELPVVLNQFIDQSLRALVMHVVVPGTVYQQQLAFEL